MTPQDPIHSPDPGTSASTDPKAPPAQPQSPRAIPVWVLIMSGFVVCIIGFCVCLTINGCRSALVQEDPEPWIPSALGEEWNDPRVQEAFRDRCQERFQNPEGCDLLSGLPPRFRELQDLETCQNPNRDGFDSSPRPRLYDFFFLAPEPTQQASRLLGMADRDLSCDEYLAYTQAVSSIRASLAHLITALDDILTDRNQHQTTLSAQLSWGTPLLEKTAALIEQAQHSKQQETISNLAQEMGALKLPFFVADDAEMTAYLNEVFGGLNGSSLRERLTAYREMAKTIEHLPFMMELKKTVAALERFDRQL